MDFIERFVNTVLVAALAELATRSGTAWATHRKTSMALLAANDLGPWGRAVRASVFKSAPN